MHQSALFTGPSGKLALEHCGWRLPLQVLRSAAGFYLGTFDESGPVSRESVEYWGSEAEAEAALASNPPTWTQKEYP